MMSRVLFIGSESYDAATITVLQGLQGLGYTIYTIGKSNINSWFCNTVLERDGCLPEVDFVLSNLHWGTRWGYYEQYDLPRPWVLIDGDDAHYKGWRAKLDSYVARYRTDVPSEIKNRELSPYRWMEPLPKTYEPDIVFCPQNPQAEEHYLPFGIHREYLQMSAALHGLRRDVDFACLPRPGYPHAPALAVVAGLSGHTWTKDVRGRAHYPESTEHIAKQDRNVHSWHRWALYQDYWRILVRTKALVYPSPGHGWESKRPYEAWAAGCLIVARYLSPHLAAYLGDDAGPILTYGQTENIPTVCDFQYGFPEHFRGAQQAMAMERLTPMPIAQYFLERVHDSRL